MKAQGYSDSWLLTLAQPPSGNRSEDWFVSKWDSAVHAYTLAYGRDLHCALVANRGHNGQSRVSGHVVFKGGRPKNFDFLLRHWKKNYGTTMPAVGDTRADGVGNKNSLRYWVKNYGEGPNPVFMMWPNNLSGSTTER